jgi:long-chain-fatty-acid--CoA ligase ACSBG
LEKYFAIAKDLPVLKALVMYGPDILPEDIKTKCSIPCYTFDNFVKLGQDVPDATIKSRQDAWQHGETCSLIYTSGTTGQPKAVMITNDNITWTASTVLTASRKGYMDNTDVMISYLPLSHIAAQLLDMHVPMATGTQIYFAQPDALKGSLAQTLEDVRPTTFFGVPRVWEKFYDKLQEVAKSSTGIKKTLSTWAKEQASDYWESRQFGQHAQTPWFFFVAKSLLGKAHVALGFDRCYAFYVSAAPIDVKILKYFASLNIPIMELFGQSEVSSFSADR